MSSLRTLLKGTIFFAGVLATTATSGPSASIAGSSDEQSIVLNASTPAIALDATATLTSDVPVLGGEIGLNVVVDSDAVGSIVVGLRSSTSGEHEELDIVDTQAQGTARIGIAAFANCAEGECLEDLELTFERTDDTLDGDLGVSFQLDGFVDTDGDPTAGDLTFDIAR
jgi:hypothetical protein